MVTGEEKKDEVLEKETRELEDVLSANEFDFEDILSMEEGPKRPEEEPEELPEEKKRARRRHIATTMRIERQIYRKAFSETQLLDVLGFDFKDGESYHCISAGDVDFLSYLKVMLRQQDLEYCLFSTWCMAFDDIMEMEEWLEAGKIKRMDGYVGEIFPGSYRVEYAKLKPVLEKHGGKVVVFRNHAKIFAGYGKKFHFVVESSANINTNPRAENACLTIGKGLYDFYKGYFDGIVSYVKGDKVR